MDIIHIGKKNLPKKVMSQLCFVELADMTEINKWPIFFFLHENQRMERVKFFFFNNKNEIGSLNNSQDF